MKVNPRFELFNEIKLEWDEENTNHIRAHGVEPNEVESIFRYHVKRYAKRKGKRIQLVGPTKGSRILFVILEWQHGYVYRAITAREADVTQKRLYRKRGK